MVLPWAECFCVSSNITHHLLFNLTYWLANVDVWCLAGNFLTLSGLCLVRLDDQLRWGSPEALGWRCWKPWDWEDLSWESPDSVGRPRPPLPERPQWMDVDGWQNLWYNFSLCRASLIAHWMWMDYRDRKEPEPSNERVCTQEASLVATEEENRGKEFAKDRLSSSFFPNLQLVHS